MISLESVVKIQNEKKKSPAFYKNDTRYTQPPIEFPVQNAELQLK